MTKNIVGSKVYTDEGQGVIVGIRSGSAVIDLDDGGTITRTEETSSRKPLNRNEFKIIKESKMTSRQKQILTEKIIRPMVRKMLKEESQSGQSKPVQVGSKVVTVGLKKGTIYVYNKNMTQILCQFTPEELNLLMKMSKRKNTDEGGD